MSEQQPDSPTGAGSDVTAVIIGHDEGTLLGLSLRSLLDAAAYARDHGLTVEALAVLDSADDATRAALADAGEHGLRVVEVAYADHGLARNEAIRLASGRYVAFLDGDDLWSENWLVDAHAMCETDPGRVIAHPAINWIFDQGSYCYVLPDQADPAFDPAFLRVANAWDQLCMAPAQVHQRHPYRRRELDRGFAYLDWTWNLETIEAGLVHRTVPETIHFKRRRTSSQFTQARANKSLPFHSALHDYSWWTARDAAEAHEPA